REPARLPRLPAGAGGAGRSPAVARGLLALRPRAARHPRERGAHGRAGLRGRSLQAARVRDRGRGRRAGRLALRPVQRLDHPGRLLLEDLGRGAADGDHRRHRHAGRRGARGRRVHPPPEPGEHLHRALDADPGGHLHPVRAVRAGRHRGRPARPHRAPGVSASAPLLAVEAVSRSFGALNALARVSFQVAASERRAIIGPNGAGKTTLFNLITGHLAPSGGRILLDGAPIEGLPPHRVARRGLSRSFQRNNLFPSLTVRENLRLAAAAGRPGTWNLLGRVGRGREALDRAREVAETVGLAARLDEPAGRLSYGEQRQLEVGVALATSPRLLLLDEPTAGMSPEETQRMARMLEALPREVTLLIIEHDMDVVGSLADRVTVLHYGEVLTEGTFAEVKADPRVYEVYLGHARACSTSRT